MSTSFVAQLPLLCILPGFAMAWYWLCLKTKFWTCPAGQLTINSNLTELNMKRRVEEGRRRGGQQRVRGVDSITDSVDMSLSKLREMAKHREAWCTAVHAATKSQTSPSEWTRVDSRGTLEEMRGEGRRRKKKHTREMKGRSYDGRKETWEGKGENEGWRGRAGGEADLKKLKINSPYSSQRAKSPLAYIKIRYLNLGLLIYLQRARFMVIKQWW